MLISSVQRNTSRQYKTKMVDLALEAVIFTCCTRLVPHLDCPMLIGWDCPIMNLLLATHGGVSTPRARTEWMRRNRWTYPEGQESCCS